MEITGVINPEKNNWGADKKKYSKAIKGAGFAYENVGLSDSALIAPPGPSSEGQVGVPLKGAPDAPPSPSSESQVEAPPAVDAGQTAADKTPDQQLQDVLRQAAAKGLPVVVVYGSQGALDTEKATNTLKQNMQEAEAVYLYADTSKLDPNSELGRAARRNEEQGLGLGDDGASDLAFTAIYKVEQKSDGALGLGSSVATFWGGRAEISATMKEQLQYAKSGTLNGSGEQTQKRDGNSGLLQAPAPPDQTSDSEASVRTPSDSSQQNGKPSRPGDASGPRERDPIESDRRETDKFAEDRREQDRDAEQKEAARKRRSEVIGLVQRNKGYTLS